VDDAGVYRLSDELALVQTVDYFTPVVDDPRDYGAIAAANSLSDVYAMGGEPLTALNIVGFPPDRLSLETLAEILRGAREVLDEAGVALLGGHSVRSPEPFFGLAVTGTVHPQRILTKAGARAGDHLLLTKPLGTGILTTALRSGRLEDPETLATVTRSMRRLNREPIALLGAERIHAATDVTGFGLLGHLHEMAHQSGLRAVVEPAGLRFFSRTREMAEAGQIPGGLRANLEFLRPWLDFEGDPLSWPYVALFDPQTSGGLLLALAPEEAETALDQLQAAGIDVCRVGRLEGGRAGEIRIAT
jgi:selenide,water dikinase